MTTIIDPNAAARANARRLLDRVWPKRGVEVDQAEARRLARALTNDAVSEHDNASLDVVLLDLLNGGLLTCRRDEVRLTELRYTRPLTDIDVTAPAKPSVTMFEPLDGSGPIPYAEHRAALAAKAAAAAEIEAAPFVGIDANNAPSWMNVTTDDDEISTVCIDLRAIPHDTAKLAIKLAGSTTEPNTRKGFWNR